MVSLLLMLLFFLLTCKCIWGFNWNIFLFVISLIKFEIFDLD